MENIECFNELKQVNLEINERATIKPAIKKLAELKGGKQAILEQYTGVYTDDVLSEMLEDYHQQKISEIIAELGAYDKYSQSLVAKARTYINKLENSIQKLDDPTTKYESKQHSYLVNKLKNVLFTTFTGANPSVNELECVLKQIEYDKEYARALTHLQSMLTSNISGNNQISDELKQRLLVDLADKMQEVHMHILQVDYQTVQEIKKNVNNSIGLVSAQLHQFYLLHNIDKYKEKIEYQK